MVTDAELIVDALPKVIETETEYERLLEKAKRLIDLGEDISPAHEKLLDLLVFLIKKYEDVAYPIREASAQEVLLELMAARDLRQVDLLSVFGSKGITSEVVNGK
ncbi:type II toxin-antitoxin system HigA family antitoxin [Candidatus Cyanaurora vandensis]|uniref:helix-turn-helix domain-containing protein n=1 Tax=Candidatus Cyanaurora vandensis TaxID=2714958 RepID=UPI002579F2EC|nr:hypothetical protein [Candidatus Cyanaurora vandensis]